MTPFWYNRDTQFTFEEATARLELEFHVWADDWKVSEDALHAGWAFGVLRRWYPGIRSETLNELIQRIGWH